MHTLTKIGIIDEEKTSTTFRAFALDKPMSNADLQWNSDIDRLLYGIKAKDKPSLARLYDICGTKLLGIAVRIIKDPHEAEECLQNVFIKVWERADRYTGTGSAWGWLCVLTRNTALDHVRRLSSHPHISDNDTLINESDFLDNFVNKHDLADKHAIQTCLSKLKDMPRRAILLSFVHGYSHGELAAQLETPLGTIKAWVRRGLQELKTCLA